MKENKKKIKVLRIVVILTILICGVLGLVHLATPKIDASSKESYLKSIDIMRSSLSSNNQDALDTAFRAIFNGSEEMMIRNRKSIDGKTYLELIEIYNKIARGNRRMSNSR